MTNPLPYTPLTYIQREALNGSMLGDGTLTDIWHGRPNSGLVITRSIKDKQYLEYEASIFHNLLSNKIQQQGLSYRADLKKRTNKIQKSYSLRTQKSPSFTDQRCRWYPNGTKIIPTDLQLSAISVAHWLCDDAWIGTAGQPYRLAMEIATNGFTKSEVEGLVDLLKQRYNEDFIVRPHQRKTSLTWGIGIADSACRAIFADVDPWFHMQRKRIWNKPESCFYTNQPERAQRIKTEFPKRQKLLQEFIESGKTATFKQLQELLNYKHIDSVKDLLQSYLDSGQAVKIKDKFNNNTVSITGIPHNNKGTTS